MFFDLRALWEVVKLAPAAYSILRALRERGAERGQIRIMVSPLDEASRLAMLAEFKDQNARQRDRAKRARRQLERMVRSLREDADYRAWFERLRAEKPDAFQLFDSPGAALSEAQSLLVEIAALDEELDRDYADQIAVVRFIDFHARRRR